MCIGQLLGSYSLLTTSQHQLLNSTFTAQCFTPLCLVYLLLGRGLFEGLISKLKVLILCLVQVSRGSCKTLPVLGPSNNRANDLKFTCWGPTRRDDFVLNSTGRCNNCDELLVGRHVQFRSPRPSILFVLLLLIFPHGPLLVQCSITACPPGTIQNYSTCTLVPAGAMAQHDSHNFLVFISQFVNFCFV